MKKVGNLIGLSFFVSYAFLYISWNKPGVTVEPSELKYELPHSDSIIGEKWKLVWRDEFSEDGRPDPSKWSVYRAGTPAWMCYCSNDPETVFIKDGILNLVGMHSKHSSDTASYRTGCIGSQRKFFFKYGKVEVRAKFPQKTGTWPAVWLMPEKSVYGGWPKSGEIDIMEHVSEEATIHQTIHSGHIELRGQKDNPPYHNDAQYHIGEFNVYGLEWYPDRLDFFVNGKKTFSYPKLKDGPSEQWPFDQPFYIIFDLAIGGCDWLEAPKNEDLPATMEIDWVRVYQQK